MIFKPIDLNKHFNYCLAFRRDSHFCSFDTYVGFDKSVVGYQERMSSRMRDERWHYFHIWDSDSIIGQLEFKSFSERPNCGYVHLIYLIPEYRGSGVANIAQKFIVDTLKAQGCEQAMLSVSRINERAVRHYKRQGWVYLKPNLKHEVTDFYVRQLHSSTSV